MVSKMQSIDALEEKLSPEERASLAACLRVERMVSGGSPMGHAPNNVYTRYVKRLIDLIIGTSALIVFSPVILGAWLLVKLTSPGPGMFLQERVGKNQRIFHCCKLRSMYIDQHHRVDVSAIEADAKKGLLCKLQNDPRVTPIGQFIRRTSIDELPQLFNVIEGTMSLIGPRPLVPHMVAPFPATSAIRHEVLPGITGLWQISARSENTSMGGMIEDDLRYVSTISLATDLRILLLTLPSVLKGEGAH